MLGFEQSACVSESHTKSRTGVKFDDAPSPPPPSIIIRVFHWHVIILKILSSVQVCWIYNCNYIHAIQDEQNSTPVILTNIHVLVRA